jgi:hypothetical protein
MRGAFSAPASGKFVPAAGREISRGGAARSEKKRIRALSTASPRFHSKLPRKILGKSLEILGKSLEKFAKSFEKLGITWKSLRAKRRRSPSFLDPIVALSAARRFGQALQDGRDHSGPDTNCATSRSDRRLQTFSTGAAPFPAQAALVEPPPPFVKAPPNEAGSLMPWS